LLTFKMKVSRVVGIDKKKEKDVWRMVSANDTW